jgi:hypothetical protein
MQKLNYIIHGKYINGKHEKSKENSSSFVSMTEAVISSAMRNLMNCTLFSNSTNVHVMKSSLMKRMKNLKHRRRVRYQGEISVKELENRHNFIDVDLDGI